jgi:cyclopropane fatty-acyl-phospholipid synthase-like methyltransferase
MTNPYNEGYFERAEGSNYVNYGDDPGFLTIAALMRTLLPADSRVYELACAKGYFVKHARSVMLDTYGIDISEYAISTAVPEAAPYVEVGDALSLPWLPETADAVVSWEFLEHLTERTIDAVIDEVDSVSKPGALTIHRIGIIRTDGLFPEGEDHDHTHTLMRDDAWWRDFFASRGYTRLVDVEAKFDEVFKERDWMGRFYVYRLPRWGVT